MKHVLRWGLMLLLPLPGNHPASGAVESFSVRGICGGRRFGRIETLTLAAGTSLEIVVTGFGVDNTDRIEAISLPGVKVRLVGGRSFPAPQVTLALSVEASAPRGKGELRLRYAVEVAGYDRILVEVAAPPAIPCRTLRPATPPTSSKSPP